jgi:hypothetical protein
LTTKQLSACKKEKIMGLARRTGWPGWWSCRRVVDRPPAVLGSPQQPALNSQPSAAPSTTLDHPRPNSSLTLVDPPMSPNHNRQRHRGTRALARAGGRCAGQATALLDWPTTSWWEMSWGCVPGGQRKVDEWWLREECFVCIGRCALEASRLAACSAVGPAGPGQGSAAWRPLNRRGTRHNDRGLGGIAARAQNAATLVPSPCAQPSQPSQPTAPHHQAAQLRSVHVPAPAPCCGLPLSQVQVNGSSGWDGRMAASSSSSSHLLDPILVPLASREAVGEIQRPETSLARR